MRDIFGAVDFVIVPSRYEPFGLAAIEAMALGAIPIVARVGGLRDFVVDVSIDGGFGRTFEPGNAAALVMAVESMLERATLRPASLEVIRGFAKNAAQRRSRRAMAEGYESLYDELCNAERRGRR